MAKTKYDWDDVDKNKKNFASNGKGRNVVGGKTSTGVKKTIAGGSSSNAAYKFPWQK